MQKTLTTTALIFAGISGLMAADNIENGLSGYEYSVDNQKWKEHLTLKGSNSVTDVKNYYWQGVTVNMKQDAHYEFFFNVNTSGANVGANQFPIFNFYLAADLNSVLFGNHYDVEGVGGVNRGPAGVYHYSGNAANGDLSNGYRGTYILNGYYYKYATSGAVLWNKSTRKSAASTSNEYLKSGVHTYKVVIETFEDSGVQDKIKFLYTGPNGNGWTQDFNLSDWFGISKDHERVNAGFYVAGAGGTMTVDHASYKKELRTLPAVIPPTTEPETPPVVDPSVPEPSAFGLLAGLGAIALAASRRRRSR